MAERTTIGRIGLRHVEEADASFLFRLYASTREAELARVAWTDEQKDAFLRMQFDAQSRQYAAYPGTDYGIVLEDGVPIGRLYVSRTADEIRIVDIALVPARCGAGIGSMLLRDVIAEAERERKTVGIHVEAYNPARRLYERLGFRVAEDREVYLYLTIPPRPAAESPPVASAAQVNTAS